MPDPGEAAVPADGGGLNAPYLATCPFELIDVVGTPFGCDLPIGHEGQHVCYSDDGESCDTSQPEPDLDDLQADYVTETVRWSVRWPESAGVG